VTIQVNTLQLGSCYMRYGDADQKENSKKEIKAEPEHISSNTRLYY
jgi:hypothetical protein